MLSYLIQLCVYIMRIQHYDVVVKRGERSDFSEGEPQGAEKVSKVSKINKISKIS